MHRLALASAVLLLGLGCASPVPVDGPGARTAAPATAGPAVRAPTASAPDDSPVEPPAAPTNAPRHVAPMADTAVEGQASGAVRGLVTDVRTLQSGPIERLVSLDLRDENGVAWTFIIQGNPGITGAHAREHRDRGEPVTVTYGRAPEGLIALRVDD